MLGAFLASLFESKQLTLDDGHDGALLDSRGALETVSVDTYSPVRIFCTYPAEGGFQVFPKGISHTAKQLRLQVHGVERVGDLIVVGLDDSCRVRSCMSVADSCAFILPLCGRH